VTIRAHQLAQHTLAAGSSADGARSGVVAAEPTSLGPWVRARAASLVSDRRQFVAQVATAAVALAYLVSLVVVKRGPSGYTSLWDGWFGNASTLLPLIPIALRIGSTTRHRAAWIAMGTGVALYNVANLVYFYHDQNLHPIPSPAISDIPYLASYVAFAVGIALMTQGAYGAVRIGLRLDGAIAGLAIAAAAGLLWFDPILRLNGRPLAVAVQMSYPILDLVLLVLLIAGFAPLGGRPSLSTSLLLCGVAAFAVGDVIYLEQVAAGTYLPGTLLDGSWTIGIWLIGLAALPREDRRAERRRRSDVPNGVAIVPIVFGGISVAVLAAALVHPTTPVTVLLALGALTLVLVRMGLTLHDIREVEQHSFAAAHADELTGLHNRRAFLEDGQSALRSVAEDRHLGVALIDLDGFKEINDSLGHPCGDDLLRIVAARFAARLGARGIVSRIGGDEFALTSEVGSLEEFVLTCEQIMDTLLQPISLDGVTVRIGASLGVSIHPEHGSTLSELLRCADVAMYEAKQRHGRVRVYRAEEDVNTRDRLAMVDDLRAAILGNQLTLHYQPMLDLRTGSIRGVEALVRWRHPSFGLLYPDEIIPLAERNALIRPLTRKVITLAVEELSRLEAAGHDLEISVNISRVDLLDDELPGFIAATLASHSIDPSRLTLEITESCLGEDPVRATSATTALRSSGIRIAVDDFGVGYSALSQLLELTVDELKIDKAFVLALGADPRARAVICAIVEFAKALGLTVVAEGVENSASLQLLVAQGVDIAQGYFVACPFTSSQLREFLRQPSAILADAIAGPQRAVGSPAT